MFPGVSSCKIRGCIERQIALLLTLILPKAGLYIWPSVLISLYQFKATFQSECNRMILQLFKGPKFGSIFTIDKIVITSPDKSTYFGEALQTIIW